MAAEKSLALFARTAGINCASVTAGSRVAQHGNELLLGLIGVDPDDACPWMHLFVLPFCFIFVALGRFS
jgi:hypothetical protein